MASQHGPGLLADGAPIDQVVDQGDQRLLLRRPAGGLAAVLDRRFDLFGSEAHSFAEEGDVHAPFVLAASTNGACTSPSSAKEWASLPNRSKRRSSTAARPPAGRRRSRR